MTKTVMARLLKGLVKLNEIVADRTGVPRRSAGCASIGRQSSGFCKYSALMRLMARIGRRVLRRGDSGGADSTKQSSRLARRRPQCGEAGKNTLCRACHPHSRCRDRWAHRRRSSRLANGNQGASPRSDRRTKGPCLSDPNIPDVAFLMVRLFFYTSDSMSDPAISSMRLTEGLHSLGPQHSLHQDIIEKGEGRFSNWDNWLYFSASDNSDPRANGRAYRVADGPAVSRIAAIPALSMLGLIWYGCKWAV